jgi:hypothetical protein
MATQVKARAMTTEAAQRRALARALGLGLAARVVRVGYGRYLVPSTSRPGATHEVTHPAGRDAAMACNCESAWRPACVHRAAVWIRKLQAQGHRATSVRPVKPEAPAPAREAATCPAPAKRRVPRRVVDLGLAA